MMSNNLLLRECRHTCHQFHGDKVDGFGKTATGPPTVTSDVNLYDERTVERNWALAQGMRVQQACATPNVVLLDAAILLAASRGAMC